MRVYSDWKRREEKYTKINNARYVVKEKCYFMIHNHPPPLSLFLVHPQTVSLREVCLWFIFMLLISIIYLKFTLLKIYHLLAIQFWSRRDNSFFDFGHFVEKLLKRFFLHFDDIKKDEKFTFNWTLIKNKNKFLIFVTLLKSFERAF